MEVGHMEAPTAPSYRYSQARVSTYAKPDTPSFMYGSFGSTQDYQHAAQHWQHAQRHDAQWHQPTHQAADIHDAAWHYQHWCMHHYGQHHQHAFPQHECATHYASASLSAYPSSVSRPVYYVRQPPEWLPGMHTYPYQHAQPAFTLPPSTPGWDSRAEVATNPLTAHADAAVRNMPSREVLYGPYSGSPSGGQQYSQSHEDLAEAAAGAAPALHTPSPAPAGNPPHWAPGPSPPPGVPTPGRADAAGAVRPRRSAPSDDDDSEGAAAMWPHIAPRAVMQAARPSAAAAAGAAVGRKRTSSYSPHADSYVPTPPAPAQQHVLHQQQQPEARAVKRLRTSITTMRPAAPAPAAGAAAPQQQLLQPLRKPPPPQPKKQRPQLPKLPETRAAPASHMPLPPSPPQQQQRLHEAAPPPADCVQGAAMMYGAELGLPPSIDVDDLPNMFPDIDDSKFGMELPPPAAHQAHQPQQHPALPSSRHHLWRREGKQPYQQQQWQQRQQQQQEDEEEVPLPPRVTCDDNVFYNDEHFLPTLAELLTVGVADDDGPFARQLRQVGANGGWAGVRDIVLRVTL